MSNANKKSLVSVIIPIYNTEEYLDECISSVISQSYGNLEILLIDDGSTDGSRLLCEKWAQRDKRIRIYYKENEGLGLTRNYGIENASGDYLIFVDSDDYIRFDLVERCISVIENENSEIVCYGLIKVGEDNSMCIRRPQSVRTTWKNEEVIDVFLKEALVENGGKFIKNIKMSLCLMMFDLQFVKKNNWKSESERNIISEDVYSLLELFCNVRVVSIIEDSFYYYRMRNDSLTHKYVSDRFARNMEGYIKTQNLAKRCKYPEAILIRISNSAFSNVISLMKSIVANSSSRSLCLAELSAIGNNTCFRKILKEKLQYRDSITRKVLVWCMYLKWWKIVRLLFEVKRL